MYYEELKTFVTLSEVKNFTKTAEILMMSQPSVSLHIKNLEKEFQTQLFQRSPKFLKITPTGEILLDRAKQMIHLYEQTKQDILEHHHAIRGELKIGASFTIGEYILPALLADLKQQYPELVLQIIIGNTDEIVQYVKSFKVDIGLIEGKTDEKEITVQPFMQDELVIIANAHHKLATKPFISMNDLQNEDWISRESGSGTEKYLNHFWHSNGLKVRSLLTISSNQGIKEAVIHGLGLSMLSKNAINRDLKLEELIVLPLKHQPLYRTFSYVLSPIMHEKGNVKSFLHVLQTKWSQK